MNVVREISRINHAELDIAINNPAASWHEQYSDSAYIFIGGLHYDLTDGDVITIFSQYGEVVDVHLPRAKPNPPSNQDATQHHDPGRSSSRDAQPQPKSGKGKHRGFGFLMYEDQRSTVLAVDNLNGAQVLGRTLRVDHVASYKAPKMRDEQANLVEAEVKSFNAAPQELLVSSSAAPTQEADDDDAGDDLQDPMAPYFQQRRREEKAKSTHVDQDDKEEKRRRKQERARIRAEREQRRRTDARASGSSRHTAPTDTHRHRHRHRDRDRDDEEARREHAPRRADRSSSNRDNDRDRFSDKGQSEGEGINRYEQMKQSRSILDAGVADRVSSVRRSRTPPSRSERHRQGERSSSSRHHRDDDRYRDSERDQRRHGNGSSSISRRRSLSPP